MPTLLKLYRADKFLVNKIVASATAFFEEIRNDPAHPFRGEFDRMVLTFVDRLGTDPTYAERIQGLKRDLLSRPELSDLARHIWANARSFFERSASGRPGAGAVSGAHVRDGRRGRWPATPSCAPKSTGASWPCCERSSPEQKSGVSTFISDQVKSGTWDN